MKTCHECGHDNPDSRQFCINCGVNLTKKANIVKSNPQPLIEKFFYKPDKKLGRSRLSKTRVICATTFVVIFISILSIGFSSSTPIGAFAIVGFLLGAIISLVMYLVGYFIAGVIEKFNF